MAEQQELDNITWLRGDSTQLHTLDLGLVHTAAMGAAFHWMNRDQVLLDLDAPVAPEGGVVLASGGARGEAEPPNRKSAVDEVRTQ